VTCTNVVTSGDVGSSGAPASITQTNCTLTGNVVAPVGSTVATDFSNAYSAFAGVNCIESLNSAYTGAVTFTPGVYCNGGGVTFTNATVTLDAQGDPNAIWIFKIGTGGSGALSGSNFSVVMANSGQANNAYWWVAEGVTDTAAAFQGSILAGGNVNMTGLQGYVTPLNGDVLANGAVTLANFTITGLPVPSSSPSQSKCNQGVGNGAEGCDPGNASQNPFLSISNDESGALPGSPGRKGGVAGNK